MRTIGIRSPSPVSRPSPPVLEPFEAVDDLAVLLAPPLLLRRLAEPRLHGVADLRDFGPHGAETAPFVRARSVRDRDDASTAWGVTS